VLTGVQVVTNAENAFLATKGDIGQKVMAAMEAARVYGGDGRCSCNDGAPMSCGCPPRRFIYSAFTGFFVIARIGDVDGATCDQATGCANGTYYCDIVSISFLHGPEPVLDMEAKYADFRAQKIGVTDQIRTKVVPFAERSRRTARLDPGRRRAPRPRREHGGRNPATLTVQDVSSGGPTAAIGTVQETSPGHFTFPLTSTGATGEGRYRITAHHAAGDVLLWPELVVRADPPTEMFAGYAVVSSSEGARVPLWLDGGAASAGSHYLILASASGQSPGTPFMGVNLPLNTGPRLPDELPVPRHRPLPRDGGRPRRERQGDRDVRREPEHAVPDDRAALRLGGGRDRHAEPGDDRGRIRRRALRSPPSSVDGSGNLE
jgi:hypothetical protein